LASWSDVNHDPQRTGDGFILEHYNLLDLGFIKFASS
jgi:hypothetical protein